MEPSHPFCLNRAIERWRENLGQSSAFRSEDLAELETHLRDSIAELEGRGLSSEEAFMVASGRIGGAPALEVEFGKVNPGNTSALKPENHHRIPIMNTLLSLLRILLGIFVGFAGCLVLLVALYQTAHIRFRFADNGLLFVISLALGGLMLWGAWRLIRVRRTHSLAA